MLSMQSPQTNETEALMATIIVLNVVFAALVVGGILTLLSWGIAADHASVRRLSASRRVARRTRRRRAAVIPATLRHTA